MGSNVNRQQRRAAARKAPKVKPPLDLAQARLLNALLNSAGFKGSEAKQLASRTQAQLESWHPELLAENND